jgi:hypothetical protein
VNPTEILARSVNRATKRSLDFFIQPRLWTDFLFIVGDEDPGGGSDEDRQEQWGVASGWWLEKAFQVPESFADPEAMRTAGGLRDEDRPDLQAGARVLNEIGTLVFLARGGRWRVAWVAVVGGDDAAA